MLSKNYWKEKSCSYKEQKETPSGWEGVNNLNGF